MRTKIQTKQNWDNILQSFFCSSFRRGSLQMQSFRKNGPPSAPGAVWTRWGEREANMASMESLETVRMVFASNAIILFTLVPCEDHHIVFWVFINRAGAVHIQCQSQCVFFFILKLATNPPEK